MMRGAIAAASTCAFTCTLAADLLVYESAHAATQKGLMRWLVGLPLPFPFQAAAPKFDAVRQALCGAFQTGDLKAFEAAARQVIGLGPGLTPSGDDFLAGIFYVLAHQPPLGWAGDLPALQTTLLNAATHTTTACAAAHLANAMRGDSFDALADLLHALDGESFDDVLTAKRALLAIGASSGSDMLAGMLTALIPSPKS